MAVASTVGQPAWLPVELHRYAGHLRAGGWVGVLTLTASILGYPVNLRLEEAILWSPDVFPNLWLFGSLFFGWMAMLMGLMFTARSDARWEQLGLVALAALVFRGMWGIVEPLQSQAFAHVIATRVWQGMGVVAPNPSAAYIGWPGVSLLGSILSQATGLDLIPSVSILTVFVSVAVGASTYLFLLNALQSPRDAAFGALLVVIGDLAMVIYLTAGPTAIVFVVLFLALLFRPGSLNYAPQLQVALVLLTGAALTHLHTATHMFFFLLGIWVWAHIARRPLFVRPSIALLALFLLVPIGWILFWQGNAFDWITQGAVKFFSKPLDLWSRLAGVFTVSESNFGTAAPPWYSYTRLFWLVFLYGLGGLVWMWKVWRYPRLAAMQTTLVASFTGLVILSGISSLVSPRGFGELLRGVTYVPFFTAPFLLIYVRERPVRASRMMLGALAMLVLITSLTSFLATNRYVNTLAHHSAEFAAGNWLQSIYGAGKGVTILLTHSLHETIQYSVLEATLSGDVEAESLGYNEDARFSALSRLIETFNRTAAAIRPGFYIDSTKVAVDSAVSFGIPLDDRRWQDMRETLASANPLVYDNGPVTIYGAVR